MRRSRRRSTTYPHGDHGALPQRRRPARSGRTPRRSRRRSWRRPRRTRRSTSPRRSSKELQSSDLPLQHRRLATSTAQPISTVECFATFKQGFCQYYAPTMAVILRDMGIPTRIVEGFLPGHASTRNRRPRRIPFSNAHAWVEVYFPGYGWVDVRPDRRRTCRPARARCRRATRSPSARRDRRQRRAGRPRSAERDDPDRAIRAGSARPDHGAARPLGPLIAVGAAAADRRRVVAFARLAARPARRDDRRRRLRHGHPDRLALRVRAAAGRRPSTSTPASLGEVLPDVRPELETVARAKVESAYARQVLGDDRLADAAGGPAPAPGRPSCGSPSAARTVAAAAERAVVADALPGAGRVTVRGRRRWRAPRAPRRPPRPPGRRGAPVRLWARRTGRPARSSTTVIAHRSIDHIQKRSSGRSNRVSRATLKTPSWPTTIDHGWLGRRVAVAGDLRTGRACPAPGRRRAAPGSSRAPAGRVPATSGSDSPPGAQAVERAPPPGRELGAVARARSRRDGGPPSRPGRSRGSPGRAGGRALEPARAQRVARWPSAVSVVRAERRVDDLERRRRPGPAGPAAACGAASRSATSAAWRRPSGGQRRVGLALEAALGDERRLAVADEDERRVEAVGDERRRRSAVSARPRAGSSTGRGPPPASGSPRTRPPARRRRGPGS